MHVVAAACPDRIPSTAGVAELREEAFRSGSAHESAAPQTLLRLLTLCFRLVAETPSAVVAPQSAKWSGGPTLRQGQVAATIAAGFGLDYSQQDAKAYPPIADAP